MSEAHYRAGVQFILSVSSSPEEAKIRLEYWETHAKPLIVHTKLVGKRASVYNESKVTSKK